jgi:hypothetical protein
MKNYIIILMIAILLPFTMQSQIANDTKENFYFGVKAGLNISNIYDTKSEDFAAEYKAGFVGGAFFTIPIGNFLGFQPEVLYAQKGYNASGQTEGNNFYSYSRTTTHIDIPLMLQIKPFSIFSFVVGPQYSYMISKKEVFKSGSITTVEQNEIKNNNLRKNTFGAVLGADVYVFKRLVISGRVGWDLQDNNGNGTSVFPRYRNTWFQGTFGFRF